MLQASNTATLDAREQQMLRCSADNFVAQAHAAAIRLLSDDGVVEKTAFNESKNLWPGIFKVTETADYIFIFITLHAAHIIPKRAFPDSESAARFVQAAAAWHAAATRPGTATGSELSPADGQRIDQPLASAEQSGGD